MCCKYQLGAAPQDFIPVMQRLHYMDNLRALAMLAGVLFHAGLAYSTVLHNYWPTADASNSVWVDGAVWFSHLFRMPLFFVVAGFFAALMVSKCGVAGMLRNRFSRVLLPFILFWPLLYLAMYWLTMQAVTHVNRPSPLLTLIKQWSLNANAPAAPPSMMHLWFLVYLMCFCVLVWVAHTLETSWIGALRQRISSMRSTLLLILLLGIAPILLVPAIASIAAPIPAPESFLPQWWALLIYGFYFVLGYALFTREALIDHLKPLSTWLLLASIIAYVLYLYIMKMQSAAPQSPVLHVLQAVLQAYAGMWMTCWCLCVGKQWLDYSNRTLRYVADASYWVYLIHLPILFAIQYALLDVSAGWQLKFIISVLATLSIAFASYQLLVRHTPVGRLLNGQRR